MECGNRNSISIPTQGCARSHLQRYATQAEVVVEVDNVNLFYWSKCVIMCKKDATFEARSLFGSENSRHDGTGPVCLFLAL